MADTNGDTTTTATDDRILPATRWSAYIILPIFVLTAIPLLVVPGRTELYFSWEINPALTPLLMGAGYGAGTYYFYRIATVDEWHRIHVLLLPGTVFAWGLTLATVLHWDAFIPDHLPTYAWVVLYVVVPILLPSLWLYNRRTDPGTTGGDELLVPPLVRWTCVAVGVVLTAVVASLYVAPTVLIDRAPWTLSPLTARTVLSWTILFSLFCVTFAFERRWSAFEVPIETIVLWAGLALLAFVRSWGDVDPSNPLLWAILGGIAIVFVGLASLHVWMNR